MLATFKQAALEQVKTSIEAKKQSFTKLFSTLASKEDLQFVLGKWDEAVAAKERVFLAASEDEAEEANDIYDLCMIAVQEKWVGFEIVGTAKAKVFAHDIMHEAIGGGFAVLGAVLQATLTVLFPGGGIVGAALNMGIQKVVAHFNKE